MSTFFLKNSSNFDFYSFGEHNRASKTLNMFHSSRITKKINFRKTSFRNLALKALPKLRLIVANLIKL